VHGSELFAFLKQGRPDPLEDAVAAPSLKPAVDRAVVAEMLGELVPLASGSEAEDDSVDGGPPVDSGATAMGLGLWRGIRPQNRLDPLAEVVVNFPDCIKGFILSMGPYHPCVSWCVR
jgi:hypothetical protein